MRVRVARVRVRLNGDGGEGECGGELRARMS